MSNELTVTNQNLTPTTWQMIKEIAPVMQESRLFGVASPEQAMAIMLKGYELGLSLTASFEFVQVIQGKPTLSPRGMLALIQSNPNFNNMTIEDIKDNQGKPLSCKVSMKRNNGFEYSTEFTMNDAKQAGLIKKDGGWDKYPANMLRWRAIGYCADVVFPDIIGGMKCADELGAEITTQGNVIEQPIMKDITPPAEVSVPVEPKQPADDIPDYGYTLAMLIEQVSEQDIFDVNDGALPVLPEDINRVVHLLIQEGKIDKPETG